VTLLSAVMCEEFLRDQLAGTPACCDVCTSVPSDCQVYMTASPVEGSRCLGIICSFVSAGGGEVVVFAMSSCDAVLCRVVKLCYVEL